MPRIRNFKELKFFKPDKNITYKHIDNLFSDEIDWKCSLEGFLDHVRQHNKYCDSEENQNQAEDL